jgi:ATP-binding cassette subfamily A (ABC1) protein 3
MARNLSGGNKRKLTTLCAMIGGPAAILLDESSAGVDPFARRRLWKTIRDESKNSALIVTTHSMEEAEALSTKLAIMVDGEFKCFGTAQHIKQKFGQGFTVKVKLDLDKIDRKNVDTKKKATKDIKIMYSAGLQDGSGSFESESNVSSSMKASTMTLKIGLQEAIEKIK